MEGGWGGVYRIEGKEGEGVVKSLGEWTGFVGVVFGFGFCTEGCVAD